MWQELDNGWTTTVELMTAVGVWMGIGWLLDTWLGTWPWLMVAGAFLGLGLGTYLAYLRHQQRMVDTAPPGRSDP
jgi:F0F1-type ATP synthase assembly protein I